MHVRTVHICTNDDIFCTTNHSQQRPSRTNTRTNSTLRFVFQVAKTASQQQVLGPLKIKKLYVLAALLVCSAGLVPRLHPPNRYNN